MDKKSIEDIKHCLFVLAPAVADDILPDISLKKFNSLLSQTDRQCRLQITDTAIMDSFEDDDGRRQFAHELCSNLRQIYKATVRFPDDYSLGRIVHMLNNPISIALYYPQYLFVLLSIYREALGDTTHRPDDIDPFLTMIRLKVVPLIFSNWNDDDILPTHNTCIIGQQAFQYRLLCIWLDIQNEHLQKFCTAAKLTIDRLAILHKIKNYQPPWDDNDDYTRILHIKITHILPESMRGGCSNQNKKILQLHQDDPYSEEKVLFYNLRQYLIHCQRILQSLSLLGKKLYRTSSSSSDENGSLLNLNDYLHLCSLSNGPPLFIPFDNDIPFQFLSVDTLQQVYSLIATDLIPNIDSTLKNKNFLIHLQIESIIQELFSLVLEPTIIAQQFMHHLHGLHKFSACTILASAPDCLPHALQNSNYIEFTHCVDEHEIIERMKKLIYTLHSTSKYAGDESNFICSSRTVIPPGLTQPCDGDDNNNNETDKNKNKNNNDDQDYDGDGGSKHSSKSKTFRVFAFSISSLTHNYEYDYNNNINNIADYNNNNNNNNFESSLADMPMYQWMYYDTIEQQRLENWKHLINDFIQLVVHPDFLSQRFIDVQSKFGPKLIAFHIAALPYLMSLLTDTTKNEILINNHQQYYYPINILTPITKCILLKHITYLLTIETKWKNGWEDTSTRCVANEIDYTKVSTTRGNNNNRINNNNNNINNNNMPPVVVSTSNEDINTCVGLKHFGMVIKTVFKCLPDLNQLIDVCFSSSSFIDNESYFDDNIDNIQDEDTLQKYYYRHQQQQQQDQQDCNDLIIALYELIILLHHTSQCNELQNFNEQLNKLEYQVIWHPILASLIECHYNNTQYSWIDVTPRLFTSTVATIAGIDSFVRDYDPTTRDYDPTTRRPFIVIHNNNSGEYDESTLVFDDITCYHKRKWQNKIICIVFCLLNEDLLKYNKKEKTNETFKELQSRINLSECYYYQPGDDFGGRSSISNHRSNGWLI